MGYNKNIKDEYIHFSWINNYSNIGIPLQKTKEEKIVF